MVFRLHGSHKAAQICAAFNSNSSVFTRVRKFAHLSCCLIGSEPKETGSGGKLASRPSPEPGVSLVSLSGGLGRLAQDGDKISNECFAEDPLSDGSAKKFEQLVFRQIERPSDESSAGPPGKTDFYLSKLLDP
jgi:hypothetical protein